jgi:UDP-N-acetylmuramoyl-tripeptide--D-alanyl-D-alanine ligase
MIPIRLRELAVVTGGTVVGDPATVVDGPAVVDSRRAEPGGLFVAVRGEHVDGHDFARAAAANGAAAVLGSRATQLPTVVVSDPVTALGRLSRHVVDALPAMTVLALTGSQGKTGTKDLLAQVLSAAGPTVATAGNLNNELGVPLTALRATPETTSLVVEMGARGEGHIAYLCRVAPPRIAAVLNVGTAHLGEFGSREAIARAKGEIVEALAVDGTAVLNADDPLCAAMATRTRARVLTFGRAGQVTWRRVEADDLGRPAFELGCGGVWARVRLQVSGAHQVANAAAAAALALGAGLALEPVAEALSRARAASRWRMEITELPDRTVVLNDSYNANPASMRAALQTLADLGARRNGRTVAVLGEMLELGEQSAAEHHALGRAAARACSVLVTVGPGGTPVADGFDAVRGAGSAVRAAGREEATAWVRQNVSAGDVVLVKASRGVALERLAAALVEAPARQDPGTAGQAREGSTG